MYVCTHAHTHTCSHMRVCTCMLPHEHDYLRRPLEGFRSPELEWHAGVSHPVWVLSTLLESSVRVACFPAAAPRPLLCCFTSYDRAHSIYRVLPSWPSYLHLNVPSLWGLVEYTNTRFIEVTPSLDVGILGWCLPTSQASLHLFILLP